MALFGQCQGIGCRWAVWRMEETEDELLSMLPHSEDYRAESTRFTSAYRRLEWLSVRVLLYVMLGEEKQICYLPSGKPCLADGSFALSISHTKGYVAVLLAEAGCEVGIDIEQYGDRVRKVASRFMRSDESAGCYEGNDLWGLLLHWSAKETMFKCMNAEGVDFKEHLCISPFEVSSEGSFSAKESRTSQRLHFELHYKLYPDFVLTYAVC